MDLMKVLIVHDGDKFTRQMILDDLKSEEFPHYFLFAKDLSNAELERALKECDEVWIFGDISGESIEKKIQGEVSADKVWVMA